MMSNGPCSSRRSVHSGCAHDRRPPSTSSSERRTWTWRKPSRCRPRSERRSSRALAADDVRAEVAVRPRRVALAGRAPRAGRARSRPANSRARARARRSGLRASGWTLVASTTVSRPRASRLRRDEVQDLERVVGRRLVVLVVGDQRRGRSRTRSPRSAGSAARERATCRSRRRRSARRGESSGISSILIASNTAICVGGAEPRRPPARPARSARRSRSARRRASAQAANSARVHSKRWSRWRNAPAGSVSNSALYSAFGVVTTTVAGRA